MKIERELNTLGQQLGIDIGKEYKEARAAISKRDATQLGRTLQCAHECIYIQHSRQDLENGDASGKKDALRNAIWAIAAVEEADRRLTFNNKAGSVAFRELGDLSIADILPGGKKVPQALEQPVLQAMAALNIPLATGNNSVSSINLNDATSKKLLSQMQNGGLTKESAGTFSKTSILHDLRPLYDGQFYKNVADYDGGMSDRAMAESKAKIAQITVR